MNPLRSLGGILLCICGICSGQTITPGAWYQRTSPTTNQLNGVSFAAWNSSFVVAGSQTTFLTSSNGIDWLGAFAGDTASTFFCATYFDGNYFVGGAGPVALGVSPDLLTWTNLFSGADSDQIFSIVSSFPTSLALGHRFADNSSYVLSVNPYPPFTLSPTLLPTTNILFALAQAVAPTGGRSVSSSYFIAVGDHGTIVTSINGTQWTLQNSGTTVALRAAVYHQGRMFVAGDSGVVLTSSDGISWSAAAPTSFDIRGLASSGNAIMAVGTHAGSGRLQVSTDGLTWPGNAIEFSQPLNAVAFGRSSFVAVGDGGLIVQSEPVLDSTVNSWTKSTSGYWEEPFWSCGRLPGPDQTHIVFANSGWKALAIGANTTANFSNSLVIGSLDIDAPSNSFNQLLLNYAGTNVPLDVLWFNLGTNASLVSYYSALVVDYFQINSPALFADHSTLSANTVILGSGLTLRNAFASIRTLWITTNATLTQLGGNSSGFDVRLDGGATFTLENGSLNCYAMSLGSDAIDLSPTGGTGRFVQNGGDVTAQSIYFGTSYSKTAEYLLEAGNLSASTLSFRDGSFVQTGGTNTLAVVNFPVTSFYFSQAHYSLASGLLISSNFVLGSGNYPSAPNPGYFVQTGGVHTNLSLSLFGDIDDPKPGGYRFAEWGGSYDLSSGLLVSDSENVSGSFTQTGGTNHTPVLNISHGLYSLGDGELSTSNTSIGGYMRAYWSPNRCAPTLIFTQTGGVHTVANDLVIADYAIYDFQAGTLSAQNIRLGPNVELNCGSGTISNWGTFTIEGEAVFRPGAESYFLGKLELPAFTNWPCGDSIAMPINLDVSGPSETVLRFRDSSDADWSAPGLQILGWQPWSSGGSSHHLFFGTNSLGLSAIQLNKITFVDPLGWAPGNYAARILSTGEVAPAVPPLLGATASSIGLVLSWSGDYELVTATNVMGPYFPILGASSPMTNRFTAREQYFRLAVPGP